MRPPWFATRLRVAPSSARVYRVGDEVASCPAASVHWLCRRWSFEYPRISHALNAAGLCDTPGCPGFSLLLATPAAPKRGSPLVPMRPAWPAMEFRVAPALASFGGADRPKSELPRLSALRYRRQFVEQVALPRESSGSGWWSRPRLLRERTPSGSVMGLSLELPRCSRL
jgi:hypothetical protein